jgi:hypothetical protein
VAKGNPQHKPTDEQRKQVQAMSGYGVPQEDIATVLDIDPKTLRLHYRRELDLGSINATAKIGETLYRQAMNGNVAAAIFWMKARAGWREKSEVEVNGKNGGAILTEVYYKWGSAPVLTDDNEDRVERR